MTQKIIATNKKAYHDYTVIEELDVGVVLHGYEIKSIRNGGLQLRDSFVKITKDNQFELLNARIEPWKFALSNALINVDPKRPVKLLAHKRQITKWSKYVQLNNRTTIIPLKAYFVKGKLKLTIGLCQGKNNFDKRQALKDKSIKRDTERALRMY